MSVTDELAKERNRAAAERTLMAWIRTSLSLISFGFGIDRIVTALRGLGSASEAVGLSRNIGLSFIAIGVLALLLATIGHRQDLRRINRGDFTYNPRISLGLVVAIALMIVGLFAFIGILL
ncbi:YidH family protein [Aliterella atlantica]|uniref:Membrane protein n=1 Tax=Aliterella atlantica CENA595 TaxID=1618023 RepID=A0A0D8ZQN7_9CYAN|nr:DUF202 domain-containing protein [Aliterella atlantica]KJH71045.1 membrane protein [Aliterella atlantica CENA595]